LQPEADGAAEATIATWVDLAAPATAIAPTFDHRRIRDRRPFVLAALVGGVGLRRVAHRRDLLPELVQHAFEPRSPLDVTSRTLGIGNDLELGSRDDEVHTI